MNVKGSSPWEGTAPAWAPMLMGREGSVTGTLCGCRVLLSGGLKFAGTGACWELWVGLGVGGATDFGLSVLFAAGRTAACG